MSEYDAFAPIYDAWSAEMTEDVDFYVELAQKAHRPVLELAVTPRIAVELDGKRETIGDTAYRNFYFPTDNRIEINLESGPKAVLWWVSRSEWEGLLDVSGLETDALYGWFDRRPFDEESREFVWVASKPG